MESSLGKRMGAYALLSAEDAKKLGAVRALNQRGELRKESFPFHLDITGTYGGLILKRMFKIPGHLSSRLPLLSEQGCTKNGLVRLTVSEYVFLRLLRACSKRSIGNDGEFARLVNGIWRNSDWNERQLFEFSQFVYLAGAPMTMLKTFARPAECLLAEGHEMQMTKWCAQWIAPVVSAGHIADAADFAAHLGFPSAAKKLLERSPQNVPPPFKVYKTDTRNIVPTLEKWIAAEAHIHKHVRWGNVYKYTTPLSRHECPFKDYGCDFLGTVAMVRQHVLNNTCAHGGGRLVKECANRKYCRAAICGFPLDDGDGVKALASGYRHLAKCENWVSPYFQMGTDKNAYEPAIGAPIEKLTIIPEGNRDSIFCKMYQAVDGGKDVLFEIVKVKTD